MLNHPDVFFPVDPETRPISRRVYNVAAKISIISSHGHMNPTWFSLNQPFSDPTELFVIPDQRRLDCGYLAELVSSHVVGEDESSEVDHNLVYGLAKKHIDYEWQ